MSKNYDIKMKMIKDILKEISIKKKIHYKKFYKFKKINTFCKSFINGLNAVSVCSLILTFSPGSIALVITALSATSLSAITSAIHTSTDVEGKVHSHNTSYLQYTDIYRDISARLFRNHLQSEDLDILLSEINARLGLIEDQSLPITIK